MKTAYVGMVGDMLHAGHINVINQARQLGEVIVGVLTDDAARSYKRLPLLPFEQRCMVVRSISGIGRVVPQATLSYRANLLELRPDYVVHGDDWRFGPQVKTRQEVIDILQQWGGELVEVPYTAGVSSTLLHEALREEGILARFRQERLKRLIKHKPLVRILEVHNALSAMIAEAALVNDREFDVLWASSLTNSISRGKPNTGIVDRNARLGTIAEIFDVTSKPLIYDGGSGGTPERIYYLSKALDRVGVSSLCIGDKEDSERNSVRSATASEGQVTIEEFCARIQAAKRSVQSEHFLLIARVESLAAGKGAEEAVERAHAYYEAGTDAILIQNTTPNAKPVLDFCRRIQHKKISIPILAAPTAYSHIYEEQLQDCGVNGVLYENHLLRAAYPAMVQAACDILRNGRAEELDKYCTQLDEFVTLCPQPRL